MIKSRANMGNRMAATATKSRKIATWQKAGEKLGCGKGWGIGVSKAIRRTAAARDAARVTTSRKAALALVGLKDDSDGQVSWGRLGGLGQGTGKVNTNTYYSADVLVLVYMRVWVVVHVCVCPMQLRSCPCGIHCRWQRQPSINSAFVSGAAEALGVGRDMSGGKGAGATG